MKIFAIGLSRTGSTSLTRACELLGYKCRHFPLYDWKSGAIEVLQSELETYDFLSDTPVALDYKRLDKLCAHSKFVYTIRDVDRWIESCAKFRRFRLDFKVKLSILALRKKIYGTDHFDEEKFRKAYARHHEEVMGYFKNRKSDLLTINICNGEGWDVLCPFLGRPVPASGFPRLNSADGPKHISDNIKLILQKRLRDRETGKIES